MKIKTSLFTGLLAASMLLLGFTSCKKCSIPESDTNNGLIETSAIVYPKVGYLAGEAGKHITGANLYADEFEVSWDGGVTKVAVDWGAYDILSNAMNVNCKASFTREVTKDDAGNVVRYHVEAATCSTCETERHVENFVLVPKVPSGYTVLATQKIIPH